MWYIELMQSLLVKITADKKEQAKNFLTNLFDSLEADLHHDKLPEGMLLGIIENAYKKFQGEADSSVPLAKFSRHVFVLAIIYSKVNDDLSFYNSDFIPLVNSLNECLDFQPEEIKNIKKLLNSLERDVLEQLDFQTLIDFSYVKNLFDKHSSAKNSFRDYCHNLDLQESPEFANFLISLLVVEPDDILKPMEHLSEKKLDIELDEALLWFRHNFQLYRVQLQTKLSSSHAETTHIQYMTFEQLREKTRTIIFEQSSWAAMKAFAHFFSQEEFLKPITNEISQRLTDFESSSISQAINQILELGKSLSQKSSAANELAIELQSKWQDLYFEVHKSNPDKATIKEMIEQFKALLHSKDSVMNEHREIWRPILINIGIALTVVGAIAIVGKTAYSGIKYNKLSFNSCLFFAKTAAQKNIDNLDEKFTAMAASAA